MQRSSGVGRVLRAGTGSTNPPRLVALVLAGGLLASACGSGGFKSASTTGGSASNVPASGSAALARTGDPTVREAVVPKFGTVLTDAGGFTLYTYTADSAGRTGCAGACLVYWPPLLLANGQVAPVSAPGITGLGTFARPDGIQVTYRGLPLYTYRDDKRPGNTTGEGVVDSGGTWYLARLTVSQSPVSQSQVSQSPVSQSPVTRPVMIVPPMTPTTSPPTTATPGGVSY